VKHYADDAYAIPAFARGMSAYATAPMRRRKQRRGQAPNRNRHDQATPV
jgi:hypothetical protein